MAADLPDIEHFAVHVIGESGAGKYSGRARFADVDPWIVEFEARRVGESLALTRLVIEFDPSSDLRADRTPEYPAGGIGSGVLGRLKVGALLAAISRQVRLHAEHPLAARDPNDTEQAALLNAASDLLSETADEARVHPRGRPPIPDSRLREVAEVRLEIQDEGLRPINAAVAHRLGLATPETAKDLVNRATARGWLRKGTVGREIREPGDRLLEAWRAEGRLPSEDHTDGRRGCE